MEAKPVKKNASSVLLFNGHNELETGLLYYFEYNFFWLYYNTSLQI